MSCTCQNCIRFKCLALPQCPGEETFTLQIGTVETADAEFNVHFSNESNGVVQMVAGESDGTGILIADITALVPYLTDKAPFRVWVTAAIGQLYDNVPFDYGSEEPADCAEVFFEKVYDADGFPYNVENQILISYT